MKDCTKAALNESRPLIPVQQAIDFCLESLYTDKSKTIGAIVASHCTYEELIGALLLAKDAIEAFESEDDTE